MKCYRVWYRYADSDYEYCRLVDAADEEEAKNRVKELQDADGAGDYSITNIECLS